MKKLVLTVKVFALFLFTSAVMAMPAHAATCTPGVKAAFFRPFPTWYQYLSLDSNCRVQSFDLPGDLFAVGLAVIEIVLRFAGVIAFGYVVFAGFKFVLSRGNPTETSKARQSIIDAVIGIAITTIASVLVAFIGSSLSK